MFNKAYSLNDWMQYIESFPIQSVQFDLKRIRKVAQQLNLMHFSIPIITITGTNGKGTCAFALEKIYTNANYRTGLFHSPHLFHYEEQIRINESSITADELCQAFKIIEEARGDVLLTLFEFTTLAALLIFQQQKLNVIILEVGMGGIHDAVNIVPPNVVIVTNVEMDHKQWLGKTRKDIALEKFGLVRCHTPVIYADVKPIHNTVQDQLNIKKAILYQLGKDFFLPKFNIPLSLAKPSIAAAIQAVTLLEKKLPIEIKHIPNNIQQIKLPGRFQIIKNPVMQVFDVAHNPSAAKLLAQKLHKQGKYNKTFAVFSMLRDKDIKGTIAPLIDIVDQWHIAPLNHPRAATIDQLKRCFNTLNVKLCCYYQSTQQAYQTITSTRCTNNRVITFGSFTLIKEIFTDTSC
jgi:dihydrofolate synthase/folylpolyglutamate synthase